MKRGMSLILSAVLVLALAANAQAFSYFTGATDSRWDDPTNWNPGIPGAPGGYTGNYSIIGDGTDGYGPSTAVVDMDAQQTDPFSFLWLGHGNSAASGTLNLTSSAYLNDANDTEVGRMGIGVLNLSNTAEYEADGSILVGNDSAADGTITLNDTTTLRVGNELRVGVSGTGVVNQNSGTVITDTLTIAENASATGTYNLDGGTLQLRSIEKGNGTAALNFNAGTVRFVEDQDFHVDSFFDVFFDIDLPQQTVRVDGTATVSSDMAVSGGTLDALRVDVAAGQTLTLSGGTLKTDELVEEGTFAWTGGTMATRTVGIAVDSAAPSGWLQMDADLTLPAGGGLNSARGIILGENGTASLTVPTDGTVTAADAIEIGTDGTLTMAGSAQVSGDVDVDSGGTVNAAGTIDGSVSAAGGSTITAADNVAMGDASVTGGVSIQGDLDVADKQVTLHSAGKASLGGTTTVAAGGQLIANNGFVLSGALETAGTVDGAVDADGGSTITATGTTALGDSTRSDGFQSAGTLSVGAHNVTLNSGGQARIAGTATIADGTLGAPNGLTIASGGKLEGSGTIDAKVTGEVNSSIVAPMVDAGTLTLGDATSYSGFQTAGKLDVGGNTVTLNSKGYAQLGRETAIAGGQLIAANGVSLGTGSNLSGYGTVTAPVASSNGSVIAADGGMLTIGDASSNAGVVLGGLLDVGANSVELLDADQAEMGPQTTLAGNPLSDTGKLIADNGFVLNFGRSITGSGVIDTPNDSAVPVMNNGQIRGTSGSDPNQTIKLLGYYKGVGSLEDIWMAGTNAPGFSPAQFQFPTGFFSGRQIMEIDGLEPGNGAGKHSKGTLPANGTVLMMEGSVLDIQWSEPSTFTPELGNTFDLFDWDGTRTGEFTTVLTPELPDPMWTWNIDNLYTTGEISVEQIPEPTTFAMVLLGGLIGLLGVRRRGR